MQRLHDQHAMWGEQVSQRLQNTLNVLAQKGEIVDDHIEAATEL